MSIRKNIFHHYKKHYCREYAVHGLPDITYKKPNIKTNKENIQFNIKLINTGQRCYHHITQPKQVCRSVVISFFTMSVVIPEELQEISTLFFGAMTGS